jgi:FkbM family methyltransferase
LQKWDASVHLFLLSHFLCFKLFLNHQTTLKINFMPITSSSTENRKGLVSFIAGLPLIRRGKIVKELFLEKLDLLQETFNNIEQKINPLQEKFDSLGQKINLLLENHTPILKATISITKTLQNIQEEIQRLLGELQKSFTIYSAKLSEIDNKVTQLGETVQYLPQIDNKVTQLGETVQHLTQIDNKVTQLEERVEESQQNIDSNIESLADSLGAMRQLFQARSKNQEQVLEKVVKTLDSQVKFVQLNDELSNPEVGLMCYLYSYLPSRRVIDIGANIGETSKCLLKAGYEVYAFEPFPSVFQKLNERLGSHPNFHSFPFAIGADNKTELFHIACDKSETGIYKDSTLYNSLVKHSMPDDLPFVDTISVNVRSLVDLHDCQEIPLDIGLVKIDTEGYDIQVIRGMGSYRYPVVVTEFWDAQFPFGRFGAMNQLEGLVKKMQGRNYNWYIVIYQVWGNAQFSFYCNHPQSVENSWGNVFFFQDYNIFSQAMRWCSATLPETYIVTG